MCSIRASRNSRKFFSQIGSQTRQASNVGSLSHRLISTYQSLCHSATKKEKKKGGGVGVKKKKERNMNRGKQQQKRVSTYSR